MIKYFCDVIRELRKGRGLTQEQLAEAFGVSCQSISKWETNSSYPDISLLPIIADYFGVSIDYLLGHDGCRQQEEIRQVCNDADAMFAAGNYAQAIPIVREMLIQHPANEKLMYKLAWALSGTLNESPDNYDEAILLYLKILEISKNTEMRITVTRDLVYRYSTKGDYEKALHYAKKLPAFDLCQEYNLGRGNLLTGKHLAEYLQSNIQLFGKAMLECLEYFECEKTLSLEEMKPYSCQMAGEKIQLIKKVLDFH